MSSIELTESQKTILQELVDLYRDNEDPVKGEVIAEQINRNAGTVRNQMQSLKALQLVEGVPGPKGGYKPTAAAYNTLDIEEMDEAESIPLSHNGEPMDEQVIQEINLMSVLHPEKCRAEIRLQGSVRDFNEGDSITVGPTPKSSLAMTGTIDGVVASDNKLIINTETMEAPVDQ